LQQQNAATAADSNDYDEDVAVSQVFLAPVFADLFPNSKQPVFRKRPSFE
jgi:hypothetical protein